jgi:dsRNA-specific ribonuclease
LELLCGKSWGKSNYRDGKSLEDSVESLLGSVWESSKSSSTRHSHENLLKNHSQKHQHQSLTLSFSRKLLNLSTHQEQSPKAIDKLQTLLANHTQIRPIESKRTQSQN